MTNGSNVTYWVDPARPAPEGEDRTLRGAMEGEKRALDQIAGSLAKLANSGATVSFSKDAADAIAAAIVAAQKPVFDGLNNRIEDLHKEIATMQPPVSENHAEIHKLHSQFGHVAIAAQNAHDRVETVAVHIDEFRREWLEHKIIMADMASKIRELEERVAVDEVLSSENENADPPPRGRRKSQT